MRAFVYLESDKMKLKYGIHHKSHTLYMDTSNYIIYKQKNWWKNS